MRTTLISKLAAALGIKPSALSSAARIGDSSHLPPPKPLEDSMPAPPEDCTAQPAPLSPRLAHTFSGHSHWVMSVDVSANGQRVVSGSRDNTAKVWCTTTGQELSTFIGHSCSVRRVTLFSDGVRVASGGKKTVRMWSLDSGAQLQTFRGMFTGHTTIVHDVAVAAPDDCTLASASEDETIKLWDVKSGRCDVTLTGHQSKVLCVAFSPDGQMLASGSDDFTIKLWCVRKHTLLRTITGHSGVVRKLAFSGERLLSCGGDKVIKVWNRESGELETTITGHTGSVRCVAVFSDDGERLVSGSADATVRIWNMRTGECEHILEGHTDAVVSVAVSRDGSTLVSGSRDKSVKVWTLR